MPSAGITIVGPSADLPEDSWRNVLSLDLDGVFYSCQAAVEHMPQGSSIVMLSSIAAYRGMRERAAYCVAKAGICALVRVLSAEWARAGRPRQRDRAGLDADAVPRRRRGRRLRRHRGAEVAAADEGLAQVDDIVAGIRYLASAEASFVTGQTLAIDGGWTWAGP